MEQNNRGYIRFGLGLLAVVAAFGLGRVSTPVIPPLSQVSENQYKAPVQKKTVPSVARLQRPDDVAFRDGEELPDYRLGALAKRAGSAAEALAARQHLVKWAKTDPLAALAFAAAHVRPMSERIESVTAILCEWVKADPEAAWLWAQEHSPNDSVGLLGEMAKVDSALAWATAEQFVEEHPEKMRRAYASAIDGMIYTGEYLTALELLEGATVPVTKETREGKYTFMEGLIAEWVRYSPEDAAAWVAALPEEKSVRKSTAYNALLATWATTAPADVLDFALTLPEGEAKTATLTGALSYLAGEDPAAAAEWLNEHGSGREFDWNVHEIATRSDVVQEAPEVAVDWALSIEAPEVREDSLVNIFADWMVNDMEGATRYLAENADLLSQEALQMAIRNAHGRLDGLDGMSAEGDVFDGAE